MDNKEEEYAVDQEMIDKDDNEDEDFTNDQEYELDQEQIIQTILSLGNEIWHNFGQEEELEDYSVFFQHQFYIRCFQMAYPDFDFSALISEEDNDNPEKMAECIQALIDLLSEEILMYDFNHIRGDEIVNGNPEHCINLLQILQQISSDSMVQDKAGNNDTGDLKAQQDSNDQKSQSRDSRLPDENTSSVEKSSEQEGVNLAIENRSSKDRGGKNSDIKKNNQNSYNAPIDFNDFERGQGNKGLNINKQQFLDNLDDDINTNDGVMYKNTDNKYSQNKRKKEDQNSVGVDKVGDAIGRQLDIEFDDDIQDNLQNLQARGSRGSGSTSEDELAEELNKNLKHQILDGEENYFEEDGEVIDHNDVNIIDGPDYNDDQNQDQIDEDNDYEMQDGEVRNLNRQQNNMADIRNQVERGQYDFNQDNQEYQDENEMIDGYGEEDEDQNLNDEIGKYKPIDYQIDRSLYQLHDQLRFDQKKMQEKQIIDDQNLNMDHDQQEDEDEEEQQDDEDEQELNLDDIDPRNLLEAAHELGLDEEGIRMLQQEMYNKQANKHEDDDEQEDYGHENMEEMKQVMKDDQDVEELFDEENDREVQEFADMLNGVNEDRNNQKQIQQIQQMIDSDEDVYGEEEEEDFGENDEQILRGGQNIEDEKEDEKLQDLEQEMAQQLKMINQNVKDQVEKNSDEDNQDEFDQQDEEQQEEEQNEEEDEEGDQLIDIDNLEDNEKAILWQYLNEQYQENPDSLPMPREIVEQFLQDNHELVQRIIEQQKQPSDENDFPQQDEYDQEFQDGQEDEEQNLKNGINSNEIEIEQNQNQDEQSIAEIIHSEDAIQDEEQEEEEEEAEQNEDEDEDQQSNYIEAVENDALEQQMQMQYQKQQAMQEQEINDENTDEQEVIQEEEEEDNQQDGEENQNDEQVYDEDEEQYEQQEYEQDGNAEDEEQAQNQIFNPQYGLDQIQEEDDQEQDGMTSDININLQPHQFQNLSQEQIQQLYLQQQMQLQMQGNQQQFLAQKKTIPKKKKTPGQLNRKPVNLITTGLPPRKTTQIQPVFNNMRPLNAAANKKYKRQKYVVNTINHDDEYNNIRGGQIDLGNKSTQRRANSYLNRPQTAKSKKQTYQKGKRNQIQYKEFPQSITPGNIQKQVKGNGIVQSHGNLMVPQQSQMFTSFGLAPNIDNKFNMQAKHALSQRKSTSNSRTGKFVNKIYGSVKSSQMRKKNQKVNKIPKNGLMNQQKQTRSFKVQNQYPNELSSPSQQNLISLEKQQINQNIVEMPILSEEFLNQLNEEQLQALLEQQQQLMMLQQQSQQQSSEVFTDNQTNSQHVNQTQDDRQNLRYQPLQQKSKVPTLRQRSRSKQNAQQSLQQLAARIPSGKRTKISAKATSGSRSAHGSKKRTQKTRSSLNVAVPLNIGSLGSMPNLIPQGSNTVFKSQKLAAQIYGNSAEQMIQNLITQRSNKRRGYQQGVGSKLGTKKRSQPNQAGKQLQQKLNKMNPSQTFDIQQQILQQQAQYNQILQQQKNPQMNEMINVQNTEEDEIIEDDVSQTKIDQDRNLNNIANDLSTEQIIQLLEQNHQNQLQLMSQGENEENVNSMNQDGNSEQFALLPQDVQLQLQQVLQERLQNEQSNQMSNQKPISQQIHGMAVNNRVQSYQNICNILTESVSKAKQKYQNFSQKSLSNSPMRNQQDSRQNKAKEDFKIQSMMGGGIETDQRVIQQKKQFENLLKQYEMQLKIQENKRIQDMKRAEKIAHRDEKIKQIKQKKFEELMLNKQKSQIIKRNAQQAKIQKKVMKLAQDLEKHKILEEKKYIKDIENQNFTQKKAMVATIENYYKDKINILKERIEQEKFERSLAQEAQKKALTQMKKELGDQKKKEVQRYIELLQQEDDKFDIQNLNLGKFENDIVKLYKKQ